MPIDRFQARAIAMQTVANAIGYRIIARSSADGNADQVEYHSGDPDQKVGAQPVRRMEPFGLHSVPPEGLPSAVVYANASPNAGMIVGVDGTRYFPAGLANGETAVYNKITGCYILLDDDGAIAATSATGKVVSINGTTYSMLATDTFLTDLKTWVAAVNAVLASNCVNGAPLAGYAAQSVALGAFNTSLGVAGSYRSTKAKNG
jgi:phage gp45-like